MTPTVPPRRLRERRHICGKYIRWLGKGSLKQLRWWVQSDGAVNCGLYHAEELAAAVRDRIIKEMQHHESSALGVWRATVAVLDRMRDAGWPVPDKCPPPKWVRRVPGGDGWLGVVRKAGRTTLLGPFSDPEVAHLEAREHLIRVHGPHSLVGKARRVASPGPAEPAPATHPTEPAGPGRAVRAA